MLVPALEENTYGAYADFAAGPQGEVDATPEMVRYISGVPFPLFNGVVRARLPSHELDARIAAILRPFAVRALPLFWWIGPSTQSADLGARLLAHGFVHEEDMPGMAVHLHALPQAPPSVPGLAVIPATTGEALGQWVQAGLRGFDFPPDLGPALLEMGTRQCLRPDPRWIYYRGERHGQTVATAALFLHAGVAGIYCVSTVPDARRQGIGAAMTWVALQQGAPSPPRATTRPRSSDASPRRPSLAPQEPDDAWGQVRAEIAREVTPENYARWFLPTRQIADAGAWEGSLIRISPLCK